MIAMASPKRPLKLIVVNGRYLHDITLDALKALEASNKPPTIFVHWGLSPESGCIPSLALNISRAQNSKVSLTALPDSSR